MSASLFLYNSFPHSHFPNYPLHVLVFSLRFSKVYVTQRHQQAEWRRGAGNTYREVCGIGPPAQCQLLLSQPCSYRLLQARDTCEFTSSLALHHSIYIIASFHIHHCITPYPCMMCRVREISVTSSPKWVNRAHIASTLTSLSSGQQAASAARSLLLPLAAHRAPHSAPGHCRGHRCP